MDRRHDDQKQPQHNRPTVEQLVDCEQQLLQQELIGTDLEEGTFPGSLLAEYEETDPNATEPSGSGRGSSNVRSRVRYWLNDIVDEMRKKSPASVQKWVDSIQMPTGGGAGVPAGDDTATSTQDDIPTTHDPAFPGSDQLAAPVGEDHDQDWVGVEDHPPEEAQTADDDECVPEDGAVASAQPEHVLSERSPKKKASPLATSGPPIEASESFLGTSTPKVSSKSAESAPKQPAPEGTPGGLSIRSFLSKKALLGKFSRSGSNLDNGPTSPGENPPAVGAVEQPDVADAGRRGAEEAALSSPFVMGKSKINEFYDKLNMNKAKYGLIKAKKLDLRNMLSGGPFRTAESSTDSPKASETQPLPVEPTADEFAGHGFESDTEPLEPERLEVNVVDADPSDAYEFSFDESFPKSDELIPGMISEEDEEEKENILDGASVHPGQGYGYDAYLNPPKPKAHRMGIGRIGRSSSENPRATARRYNLMEIGRSFSEMNDDDDSFAISECNNSCPNPSSLNTSSSINNGSTSNLTRSVPVSPIPRTSSKLSIQQDPHLPHQQQQQQLPQSSPRRRSTMLVKDSSLQSDSSRCSSVESLLNARKPDPEKILLNLGFGPAPHSTDVLAKIPKRFLKPSQVRGVDTEAFLRQQQLSMHIHENSVLGYRGLVGNPHIPPSMIVAKIMERFQENDSKTRLTATGVTLNQPDSRNSSGPPSPIPMTRHGSLATGDGRLKF